MSDDLEQALHQARMKSVLHESQLLKEVVKLQRMRIAQLEEQLEMERTFRIVTVTRADDQMCQYCALPTKHGQVFCSRDCMFSYQRIHKPFAGAMTQEARCIPGN